MSDLDWTSIRSDIEQFSVVDSQLKVLTDRKKELRDRLFALTLVEGEEDDKENVWIELPEQIGGYTALQVQRRIKHVLDEEAAREILKKIKTDNGTLWDECIEMVETLDEDKIYAALANKYLTAEDLDEMFVQQVTEAFVPVKPRTRRG